MKHVLVVALAALAAVLCSQPSPREQVGFQGDGSFLLNSGWRVQPAGKQIAVGTFPMSSALAPGGRHLLVLNGGYLPPSISVLDTAGGREIARVPVADGWLGLAFAPDAKHVYVGGGSRASVFEFAWDNGTLTPARTFVVAEEKGRTHRDFIGDVAPSPDGRLLYAADLYQDAIAVINPQSGRVIERFKTLRRPYRILFNPDGKSFFVSSWSSGSVAHHQASNGEILSTVRIGPHPTGMVWSAKKPETGEEPGGYAYAARLFVAASNTNGVRVVGVSESGELRVIENINVSLEPRQPAGMTPSALSLSEAGDRLFVTCSDANAVAVVDLTEERSRVLGFVPTGWYPTAARALADGRLVVLNGRGVRSYPNPQGPNPAKKTAPAHEGLSAVQYVGRIQTGTVSLIEPLDAEQLDAYTKTVMSCSRYRDTMLFDAGVPAGNPVPTRPGDPTPIQHVIYIVKENRTYDQVFGDLKEGNGDPSLVLFGEQAGPNHRKLAREFVLLDNFYVNSDVSADGQNWATAAIAPDYVQKLWPNSYGARRRHYDYEGQEPATSPPAGYLWTNAVAAGVSLRNYGYFVNNRPRGELGGVQADGVRDPVLAPVTNLNYRAFDLSYPDVERAKVFLRDLAEFETAGKMPRLILLRLGNDHTSGTMPGRVAPLSAFADNDYAFGMIVEAVSKSPFWATTAIFVLEDDAQNGADHVDSHRSPAFVISPYVKRRSVDSTMYNTASVLRTMELILGLRPMTHFDAAARPMYRLFQATPDTRAYVAEKPRIALDERNPAASPTAARSMRLDFEDADRIDGDELNAILWAAIQGAGAPPPPARSFFSR
jgi:DNA-binding beta-propeller fold protein YncE